MYLLFFGVAKVELEVMRGGRDKLAAELNTYDDLTNPGDLWFPFRAKCFAFTAPNPSGGAQTPTATYQFCPMQVGLANP